ncbi:MAG: hypothetical protein ACRDNZ_03550 [Streptosporangiaceae bacterium]
MPVVLMLAAVVILAGVVVVAMGRGGELALARPDSAAYGRELVTPADMVAFRPPAALLGYSAPVTDDALRRIARAVAERDAELAMLRHEVAALRACEFQAPAGPVVSPVVSQGDAAEYGSALSFGARAAAAGGELEQYESELVAAAPADADEAGDPGAGS